MSGWEESYPGETEERRQRYLKRYAKSIEHEEKERAYFRSLPGENPQSFASQLDASIGDMKEEVRKLRTRTSFLD